MPRLTVSLGRTINLGNYESYRADVSLEDSKGLDETGEEAYQRISKVVREMLDKEINPVLAEQKAYEKRRKKK